MAVILAFEDSLVDQQILETALGRFHGLYIRPNMTSVEEVAHVRPDLIILDLHVANNRGLEIFRAIRGDARTSTIPMIFVSDHADAQDAVSSCLVDADDFISKPLEAVELRLRAERLIKRTHQPAATPVPAITAGPFHIDIELQQVTLVHPESGAKTPTMLTPIEFRLFMALIKANGRTMTRLELLGKAWAQNVHVTERSVDTHIKGLRMKLRPFEKIILSAYGVGYRLNVNETQKPAAASDNRGQIKAA